MLHVTRLYIRCKNVKYLLILSTEVVSLAISELVHVGFVLQAFLSEFKQVHFVERIFFMEKDTLEFSSNPVT